MSDPLLVHEGLSASLMRDNIDTDQIIPSREMKSVSRNGLADGLFAGWRYIDPERRSENPEFILNAPEQAGTSILITGENFGCGSSREHAVWALKEYGFRVIIAQSFGEIFHGNCIRNGILPITLDKNEIAGLLNASNPIRLRIDLVAQIVTRQDSEAGPIRFEMGAFAKRLLTEGLDPISLTLKSDAQIAEFLARDVTARPWVYSAA